MNFFKLFSRRSSSLPEEVHVSEATQRPVSVERYPEDWDSAPDPHASDSDEVCSEEESYGVNPVAETERACVEAAVYLTLTHAEISEEVDRTKPGLSDSADTDVLRKEELCREEGSSSSSGVVTAYEGDLQRKESEATEELLREVWVHTGEEVDYSPISDSEGASAISPSELGRSYERSMSFVSKSVVEETQRLLSEVSTCMENGGTLLELNKILERSHGSLSWKKINTACKKLGLHLCTREYLGEGLREDLLSRSWSRAPMRLLRSRELRAVRRAFCVKVRQWPAWY
jgi:hypothetical protein